MTNFKAFVSDVVIIPGLLMAQMVLQGFSSGPVKGFM